MAYQLLSKKYFLCPNSKSWSCTFCPNDTAIKEVWVEGMNYYSVIRGLGCSFYTKVEVSEKKYKNKSDYKNIMKKEWSDFK